MDEKKIKVKLSCNYVGDKRLYHKGDTVLVGSELAEKMQKMNAGKVISESETIPAAGADEGGVETVVKKPLVKEGKKDK